ncbi:MAG TPA: lysophospholipid acyltransferase family protein [Allosphingosinicella sp.]|jgi:1-acyl-sn-glycerol-3-phosphate acyltransferase
MNALRTLAFSIAFYGGTVLFVATAALLSPFGRTPVQKVAEAWARYHRRCAAGLLGICTRLEGAVPTGAVLVACKHQAMFETLEVVIILCRPQVVMKSELARIPVWGWIARRYGMIPVDRAGGAAALRRLMVQAREAVAEGRPIVIFPEGTRVAPGEQPELQPGFAGLYRAFNLPVVPVALDSGRLWPRHGFTKRSGVVTMRFGAPIPPGLPRREIEARVHAAINALERPGAERELGPQS